MNSLEAEKALIGSIILKAEKSMPFVLEKIISDDFQYSEYKTIFEVCKEIYEKDKPIDVTILSSRLDTSYMIIIVDCSEACSDWRHVKEYIEIVKANSMRRRALCSLTDLEEALLIGTDVQECQNLSVKVCECFNLPNNDNSFTAKDGFMDFILNVDKPKNYIKTGITKLDQYIFFEKGDYIIIGGRPSTGKTALTIQMMLYMARTFKVVYFSLETNKSKIISRAISNFSKINYNNIKLGKLTMQEAQTIADDTEIFTALNFTVVEASGWTVSQIRAKATQLKAEIIFIDYLQLCGEDGKLYEKVTKISIGLHVLAQQSKIGVVALSQLKRLDGNKEPILSDLRESGQIEQDADAVIFTHREMEDGEYTEKAKLITAKNKEGKCGAVKVNFQGEFMRFTDIYGGTI